MKTIRLRDVPSSPAYLVCHDHYDNGAMDVWPYADLERATEIATQRNHELDEQGLEGCHWRAYTKLPRVKVWNLHKGEMVERPKVID